MTKAYPASLTVRLSAVEAGALENLVQRYRRDVDSSMTASAVVRRLILDEERRGAGGGEVTVWDGSPLLNIRMTRWSLAMLEAIQAHDGRPLEPIAGMEPNAGAEGGESWRPSLSEIIWRLVVQEYRAIPKAPGVAEAVEAHRVR